MKGNDRPGEQRRYVLVGTTAMNMYVGLTLGVEKRPKEGVVREMERAVVSAESNTATVICKRWLAISFLLRMFGISSPQISEIIFLDRKSLFLREMMKKITGEEERWISSLTLSDLSSTPLTVRNLYIRT